MQSNASRVANILPGVPKDFVPLELGRCIDASPHVTCHRLRCPISQARSETISSRTSLLDLERD